MDFFNQLLKFPSRRRGDMASLVRSLLRIKGEASAIKLAYEILQRYANSDQEQKYEFFKLLLIELGPDEERLDQAIKNYSASNTPSQYLELLDAVEPARQDLIRTLNWTPQGTSAIIAMRADLLKFIRDDASLAPVDYDFQHLLNSWFNRGFLELRRISWETPAFILEKLIHYESVHEITDWRDLQRRLEIDRRCFAFFHPQLPNEPLIFVEVALSDGLVSNIDDVLRDPTPTGEDEVANTAIFYSINNCQKGLTGISFGNFLIKQVADELAEEIPSLKHFATLSPIPGFKPWMDITLEGGHSNYFSAQELEQLQVLTRADWWHDPAAQESVKPILMKACAKYLLHVKRGEEPADAVARFHLSNGARIEQLNWLGDVSTQRMRQSYGMLVNYVYDRRAVIKNHEAYVAKAQIAVSSQVNALAK